MTKQERLNQLKDQGRFYKILDKHFDRGWRAFVKDNQNRNDISNIRMFKILVALKGEQFLEDLINLMKKFKRQHALLRLSRKAEGVYLKDARFNTIHGYLVFKFPSGYYNDFQIFIQVKLDRWVSFTV